MTCCIIGHSKIEVNDQLKERIERETIKLIEEKNVDTFLFGSKSMFNDLCYEIISDLKEKYEIKRIYVRAEYPVISEEYKKYLLESYEDTIYPETIKKANKFIYVERNCYIIDKSDYCLFYYDKNYNSLGKRYKNNVSYQYTRKSGTAFAYQYAVQKKRCIINLV